MYDVCADLTLWIGSVMQFFLNLLLIAAGFSNKTLDLETDLWIYW